MAIHHFSGRHPAIKDCREKCTSILDWLQRNSDIKPQSDECALNMERHASAGRRSLLAASTAGAFSVIVYAPLAARRSAWSDDFPLLFDRSMTKVVADGRPVLAIVNSLIFGAADNIAGLAASRLIGVAGIACLVAYLTWYLLRTGWPPLIATLTGCSIGLLPPFHAYAGWASVFSFPWVMLLGAVAGQLWVESRQEKHRSKAVLGFLGMTISLLAYPPAAMFCWVPLGIRLMSRPDPPRAAVSDAGRLGLLILTAGPVSLLIARLSMVVVGVSPHSRFNFIDSLPEVADKLRWFVSRPPAIAVRPFMISSPSDAVGLLTAAPVLVLIVVGVTLRYEGSIGRRLFSLTVVGGVAVMTMFSHLVAAENQTEFRYMAGLIVLTWVALILAGREIASRALSGLITPKVGEIICAAALVVVVVVATAAAHRNVDQVFIRPAEVKEEYLLERLESFDPVRHNRILVIDAEGDWPSRDNLGIYSVRTDLAHSWVIEPNVRLLLTQLHGDTVQPEIVIGKAADSGPGDLILDLRPLVGRF